MEYFITFQKSKGLNLHKLPPSFDNSPRHSLRIQTELLKYGFVFTSECFGVLENQPDNVLTDVYRDLCAGLERVVGTSGYEPIYRNFPQSVQNMSQEDFVWSAIHHYWSAGTWRPDDLGYLTREFKLDVNKLTEIGLITDNQYESIFTNLIYSNASLSHWDKEIVDYFILNESIDFDLDRISFKETKAYIGKLLLDSGKELSIRSATDLLRIYAAYSGGDEGLKQNTKFKNPSRAGFT